MGVMGEDKNFGLSDLVRNAQIVEGRGRVERARRKIARSWRRPEEVEKGGIGKRLL